MSRKYTNKLIDMISNMEIESETVIMMCLKYMSEDEVKDMMEHNDILENQDEENEN